MNSDVSAQNDRGEWVPAIPLAYVVKYMLLTQYRCSCGKIYWSEEAYQGHYALKHILAL